MKPLKTNHQDKQKNTSRTTKDPSKSIPTHKQAKQRTTQHLKQDSNMNNMRRKNQKSEELLPSQKVMVKCNRYKYIKFETKVGKESIRFKYVKDKIPVGDFMS